MTLMTLYNFVQAWATHAGSTGRWWRSRGNLMIRMALYSLVQAWATHAGSIRCVCRLLLLCWSLGDIELEVQRKRQRGQSVSAVNCGRLCGVRLRSVVTAAYIIILRHSSGARLCLEPASSKLRASWEDKGLCTSVSTTVLRRQLSL